MDAMLYKGQFANLALAEFVLRYEVFRFVFSRYVLRQSNTIRPCPNSR